MVVVRITWLILVNSCSMVPGTERAFSKTGTIVVQLCSYTVKAESFFVLDTGLGPRGYPRVFKTR